MPFAPSFSRMLVQYIHLQRRWGEYCLFANVQGKGGALYVLQISTLLTRNLRDVFGENDREQLGRGAPHAGRAARDQCDLACQSAWHGAVILLLRGGRLF